MARTPNKSAVEQLEGKDKIIYEARLAPKEKGEVPEKGLQDLIKELGLTKQAIFKREKAIIKKVYPERISDQNGETTSKPLVGEDGFVICDMRKFKIKKRMPVEEFRKMISLPPRKRLVECGSSSTVDIILEKDNYVVPGKKYYTL